MRYDNIICANFIERPNRFTAYVNIAGERTKVHVKNTGRCRELLQDNAVVYLEQSANPARTTSYDLVVVDKGGRLINMDSNAPNKVVGEWLENGGLYRDVSLVRPERTFGNSRFDFYVESESGDKAFIEVKGVTLENGNIAAFPDAPSERAVRHVEELMAAHAQGYDAYLIFVIQMKDILRVEPNWKTHPEFGEALKKARNSGVQLLAYDCLVETDSLTINERIPVVLDSLDLIASPLLAWYDAGRRILPWREEPTPYHVWLSEIMLQQTRVEAVKPYYDRFLQHLPDIESLAAVEEEQLLKLWEGLGYYNRARNLKKSAVKIMEEYGGEMPGEYEQLIRLAGIGSYTAGAVASIAFHKVVPAVDGNVLRIISRLRMDDRDILDARVRKSIEAELQAVMPKDRPGDFNQALMELGAMVCIPNGAPRCGECPWREFCQARIRNCISEYPKKAPKKPRKIENKTVLVLLDEHCVALHKREEKGLLAGMYEFPMLEGHKSEEEVLSYLKQSGLSPLRIQRLEASKHIFTHKEWHMIGYQVRVDELMKADTADKNGKDMRQRNRQEYIFIDPAETRSRYPIPSAFAAYADYMEMKRGI
ncbi:MAG: A/G-specific adenine glycosylase [Lachnospiraceae bacterium]|nr:A/G-specific adenine glycosylase [Lachnospiraceae bacterium]